MNWPKKWVDAILAAQTSLPRHNWDLILKNLHAVGALKDPPKPREWWINRTLEAGDIVCESKAKAENVFLHLEQEVIHVREVMEEEGCEWCTGKQRMLNKRKPKGEQK